MVLEVKLEILSESHKHIKVKTLILNTSQSMTRYLGVKIMKLPLLVILVLCASTHAYFVPPGDTFYIRKPWVFIIATQEATYKVVCKYVAINQSSWTPKYCQLFIINTH